MEEKEITEQESLALISQMIKKTNKQMRIGSGDFMLVWGWVLFLVSLIVNLLVVFTHNAMFMWGYFAIFVIGCPLEWLMSRKKKTGGPHVKTYMEEVIGNVWKYISYVLFCYAIFTIFLKSEYPQAWLGMWVLGIFMPTIGSGITGAILKTEGIEYSTYTALLGCIYLIGGICSMEHLEMKILFFFPIITIFSMIIPGYLINRQAKRLNAE